MNNFKIQHNYNNPASFLLKITSSCNDSCDFCLEHEFIKSGRPPLSLDEFKKNYFYLKKKFNPDYIILTGGEPTLHPQFFEILIFLKEQGEPFRFITNLIKFNENNFVKQLKPFFSDFKSKKQASLTKIIASINDLPDFSKIAKLRSDGLIKALKAELPLMVTLVIYKRNIYFLTEIALWLKKIFKKYAPGGFLHVEFRLIYIEGTLPRLLKLSLPKNFQDIKKAVEASIEILDTPTTKITLWNFPLCYLNNFDKAKNEAIFERQKRRLIKIHHNAQFDKVEIRDWEEYLKPYKACKHCRLRNFCSGIDEKYIKYFNYPKLIPFR